MRSAAIRLHAAFAGMGATAAAIPAVLPSAQSVLGAGVLAAPPVLFAGLLLGVGAVAALRSQVSPTKLVAVGAALQALALLVGAASSHSLWFVLAAGVAGFGFGVTESSGGVAAKALAKASAAGAITGLITTTAVTAAVMPLIVWLATAALAAPLLILFLPAVLNLGAAVLMARIPSASTEMSTEVPASAERAPAGGSATQVALFAAAVAVYVGVESVISGWSSAIPFQLLAVDSSMAALGTSAFWMLMAAGRAVAGVALRRGASAQTVLLIGAAAGALALGLSAVMAAGHPIPALLALAVALVALAPTYGLVLGSALDRCHPDAAARVASIVIASGACGGAVLPLALVWAGVAPGDPATFAACAVGTAVLAGLVAAGFASRRVDAMHP